DAPDVGVAGGDDAPRLLRPCWLYLFDWFDRLEVGRLLRQHALFAEVEDAPLAGAPAIGVRRRGGPLPLPRQVARLAVLLGLRQADAPQACPRTLDDVQQRALLRHVPQAALVVVAARRRQLFLPRGGAVLGRRTEGDGVGPIPHVEDRGQ